MRVGVREVVAPMGHFTPVRGRKGVIRIRADHDGITTDRTTPDLLAVLRHHDGVGWDCWNFSVRLS